MLLAARRACRGSEPDAATGRWPCAAPSSTTTRRVSRECLPEASARSPRAVPPAPALAPGRSLPACGPTPRSTGRSPLGRRRSARRRSRSGFRLPLRLASIDDRTDLHQAAGRPPLRHLDGLIQVGDVDFGIAPDRLLALDKGAVRHHRFSVVELDSRRGAVWLELVSARYIAPISLKPLVDRGIGRLLLGLGHRAPLLRPLLGVSEQQYVFHRGAPP